jgi:hypothetical protein
MGGNGGNPRRPGPKIVPLLLTDEERSVLQSWTRRRKSSQALALGSRIVLACRGNRGADDHGGRKCLGVTPDTVRKWRKRFAADRLEGPCDEPRPDATGEARSHRVARRVAHGELEQTVTQASSPGSSWSSRASTASQANRPGSGSIGDQ